MTKQWNDYREVIIGQYMHQNKPLHEVQRIMEEKYKFKASIRAYRSRFDRWKIYKYSCRKRRDSITHSEKTSNSGEATLCSPRDGSPGSSPTLSPVMTSSDFFPSNMCTEPASPEVLGSSITIPKFDSRQHYNKITGPTHPVAVGLPSPPGGFTQDHFRYPFEQQHYLGLHMSDRTAPDCYRASHEHSHEHLYHPDQSPPPRSGEHMRDVALDASPTAQNGFSQLHSATSMGYNYPLNMLKAPRD